MEKSTQQTSADPRRVWLLAALWGTALLSGAHLAILFGQDFALEGLDWNAALWNLKRTLGATLLASLFVAFFSASFLVSVRHLPRGLRVLVGLLCTLLFAACIGGLGYEQAARIPDVASGNGAKGWIVIDTLAIFIAIGMVLILRRRRALAVSIRTLLVPAAVLVLSFGGLSLVDPPPIEIRHVVRSLLTLPRTWNIQKAAPGGAPGIGTLTPKNDWRGVGGDRSTLFLPPGGEISFEVTEEDGYVSLQTAVAINELKNARPNKAWMEVRFGFQILVDGVLAAEETLRWGETPEDREHGWREIGGEKGLPLRPGDVVTMRTTVEASPPDPKIQNHPWRLGFSDPLLVRLSERRREESSPEHPNIVLVVMDTQRRDRIGCYGYEKDTTPNLDRLAERGVVYEQASATASWTWPSTASILTGMTPERHGVTDESSCHLSRDFDLLAEALQREGYTTAAYSGNALISPSKHFDQGFESFLGGGRSFFKSRLFVPKALEWMKTYAGQRFFLYLHLVDPHHPHQPRAEAREKFVTMQPPPGYQAKTFSDQTVALRHGKAHRRGMPVDSTRVVPLEEQERLSELYDACVATGDYWFGEVLNTIEDLGLEDETIVAFTADHGEELFDHHMLEHGHSLYGELVDVPLVLAGPGIPQGVRVDSVVSNLNLGPTLAKLGGSQILGVEGTLDLSRPSEVQAETITYSTEQGWWNNWYRVPLRGLREEQWILHFAPEAGPWRARRPTPGGEFKLFDVETDPGQHVDLSKQQPERAAAMLERLKLRNRSEEDRRTSLPIGAGDETLEMLQGIGYIDGAATGNEE